MGGVRADWQIQCTECEQSAPDMAAVKREDLSEQYLRVHSDKDSQQKPADSNLWEPKEQTVSLNH